MEGNTCKGLEALEGGKRMKLVWWRSTIMMCWVGVALRTEKKAFIATYWESST
jgi:hypothetical protein